MFFTKWYLKCRLIIKFTYTGAINAIPRSSLYTGRALRNIHFSNGNACVPFYISRWGSPLRYIHISNDNGSFTFYVDCFLSSITNKTFTGLDCIYEVHGECLIGSRNCVPVAHLSSFLCCYFALLVSFLCVVPRLFCLWIINVCFACLPAVSSPTIALSMDYQCLISPSLFSVLLFCFVCLPAVSCPTIALSMDYQCLISPSPLSSDYLHVMLSIRLPSIVRCTRCHCVW